MEVQSLFKPNEEITLQGYLNKMGIKICGCNNNLSTANETNIVNTICIIIYI